MTMSIATAPPPDHEQNTNPMEWSAEEEIQLFFALDGLKPVGVNKHFYMACIADRLSKSLNRDVPAVEIWAHLRTIYNLEMLDEMEPLPFPNEEIEFSLPDDYSSLLSKKRAESEEKSSTEGAVPRPPSIIAVATDNTSKEKSVPKASSQLTKELDKKIIAKLVEVPKRAPKRTRGSMSLESSSPSTTPPPLQSNKRRRI